MVRSSGLFRCFAMIACAPLLHGCITFLAGDNIDTARGIQEIYDDMRSDAEASGVDVEAALAQGKDSEDTVAAILSEAAEIARKAAATGEHSEQIEALNRETLDRSAQQQAALNAFSEDIHQFEQAAAWTVLETERLSVVDQELLALDGYMDCGGSALGTAKCIGDIGARVVNVASFAGITIPGGQVFGVFAIGTAIAGAIAEAVRRGELMDQRQERLEALEYVATRNLAPEFENVEYSMTYALSALEPELQPPGWREALAGAAADVDAALAFVAEADSLLERYEEEAEEDYIQPGPTMTPEAMAELTGMPVERFIEPRAVAFKRFWAEANEMTAALERAINQLRGIQTDLQSMIERNQSAGLTGAEAAALGETEGRSKTELLKEDSADLKLKLARIQELEGQLAEELGTDTASGACPTRL